MDGKNLEMNCRKMGRDPLRNRRESSRNTSPLETEPPGINPERGQAPGNRHLTRVSGTGGRRVTPGGPGNRLAWRDEPGEAPSISYMEGASLFCPLRSLCLDFPAGKRAVSHR